MDKQLLQKLVGDKIISAEYDKDCESWLVKFKSEASLNIESMWRLLEKNKISSTCFDHAQSFGNQNTFNAESALTEMAEYEITSLNCNTNTGDLTLQLEQNFILQIITTSAGYESWQYKSSCGKRVIASNGHVSIY